GAAGGSGSPRPWSASSRVGTTTRPRGCRAVRLPLAVAVRTSSGSPKARVLPEPVSARPRPSRPARASGRVRAWMGRGVVMSRAASAATRVGGTPSSAKELPGVVGGGGGGGGGAGEWDRHSVQGGSGAPGARQRSDDQRRQTGVGYEQSTWLVTTARTDRPRSIRSGRRKQTSRRARRSLRPGCPRWSTWAHYWGGPPEAVRGAACRGIAGDQ